MTEMQRIYAKHHELIETIAHREHGGMLTVTVGDLRAVAWVAIYEHLGILSDATARVIEEFAVLSIRAWLARQAVEYRRFMGLLEQ